MTDEPVIDGVVVDDPDRRELVPAGPGTALAVTPTVQASELVERLDVIREAQAHAMVRDVDYGVIPGTNKPTLLKPGAEKLSVLFQLDVQLPRAEEVKTWGPGDHLTVEAHAIVYHAPTGARLGSGEGVCSTRERKYAKRKQERICPDCGMAAVIKGKAEYGGGWLCFRKKDGCGAKWRDGDPVIEAQPVGEIDNPDLPDLWNTVTKMARKRARVDAVLAVTGASALFTQDVEDTPPTDPDVPIEPAAATAAAAPADPNRPVSPSDIRLIYDKATDRLSGVELLTVLLEAQGKPMEDVTEMEALGRINDVIKTLPAGKVPDVIADISR